MPPEITIALLAIATAAAAGIAKLIPAMVDRRVKKMSEDAEQERKDRELRRTAEMEKMRQETAKAQADAEQAKAIGENLTNLTSAVLQMVQANAKEQHANREVLVNNTQTVGDLAESVDKMALHVGENNKNSREVIKAVDQLKQAVTLGVDRIISLLSPAPATNVVNVNTGTPASTEPAADAGDGVAA